MIPAAFKKLFARIRKRSPLKHRGPRRLRAFLRRFSNRKVNLAAFSFLLFVGLTAVFADIIASDFPLIYSIDGKTVILPGRFGNPSVPGMDNIGATKAARGIGDFVLIPPIPFGPNRIKINGAVRRLEPPSRMHFLGTDDKGRDVAARIIHGARSVLLVGMGSVGLYLIIAVLIGAMAGYFGGTADRLTLRTIETFTSFPTFFLILAIQGIIGATGILQLILVIGLTKWTDAARLIRAEVLRVMNEEYVLAAKALGLRNLTILFRHVLPAAMGPALVAATFGIADAILIESTLSFLGFGVPNTVPSWGRLLTDAFYNEGAYWLALFPGLILFFTLISINLAGEGAREALDPNG
jgi:peptide/nickel transport system permease protein